MNTSKEIMMDIAEQAVTYPDSLKKSRLKPGDWYMKFLQEQRDVLKDLKSDDIKNVRWPLSGDLTENPSP